MYDATEKAAVVAAAAGVAATFSTAWLKADQFIRYLAIAGGGAGVTALDAKIEQATDNAGAGAKDITAKVATQVVVANNQIVIGVQPDDLDLANNFNHFRLTITAAGAGAPAYGVVLGIDGVNGPAKNYDAASVAQVL